MIFITIKQLSRKLPRINKSDSSYLKHTKTLPSILQKVALQKENEI